MICKDYAGSVVSGATHVSSPRYGFTYIPYYMLRRGTLSLGNHTDKTERILVWSIVPFFARSSNCCSGQRANLRVCVFESRALISRHRWAHNTARVYCRTSKTPEIIRYWMREAFTPADAEQPRFSNNEKWKHLTTIDGIVQRSRRKQTRHLTKLPYDIILYRVPTCWLVLS